MSFREMTVYERALLCRRRVHRVAGNAICRPGAEIPAGSTPKVHIEGIRQLPGGTAAAGQRSSGWPNRGGRW